MAKFRGTDLAWLGSSTKRMICQAGPFRPLSIFYVPSFPENSVLCCIIVGNSVFHLHHFRDSSVSYVPSFPGNSGCHFHHFHDFPSLMVLHFRNIPSFMFCSFPSLMFHHFRKVPSFIMFRDFSVSCVPALLPSCISTMSLMSSISGKSRLAFPPFT